MTSIMNGSSAAFNIYPFLPQLLTGKSDLVLATVAATRGSAPQRPGCSAVFDENRLVAGTIGGGIVEFSVQKLAQDAVRTKHPTLHAFSLTNEISDKEGAICGGTMEILLDAEPEKHTAVFEDVKKSLRNREPGVMLTHVRWESTAVMHIDRVWITGKLPIIKGNHYPSEVNKLLQEMLANPAEGDFRRTDIAETSGNERQLFFLEAVVPLPRLVIAGAGHVGKALAHQGKLLGFEVVVWDYRSEYATKENLPDADILLSGNMNETLAKIAIDRNTYVTAVTTGHKHDMEVLKLFIDSSAGYIGMIGSKKKAILVRDQFLSEGWATKEQWERIYSPVGLDIHSETVEEIAVSIAAQLVQVRHQLNKRQ